MRAKVVDRPYSERQRNPGDVEAVEGMGTISDHEKERFVPGDRGVGMYRNRIRKYCLDLEKGIPPPQPGDLADGPIPTYGSDTVLAIPGNPDKDDALLLRQTNDQVMDILFANDHLPGQQRDDAIIGALQETT